MLISIFTPTHRPEYIRQVWDSLVKQTEDVPFEWVIAPNGECKLEDIPANITQDARVRLVPAPPDMKNIGALKLFACQNCKGDMYVELDHDDLLAPHALEALANAYEEKPDGFFYSDFINFKPDGTCEVFNRLHGWQLYNCIIDGKPYVACSAFAPTARALCEIFYAPNHVRAWSRRAYIVAGGHDPNLKVGDDHDLVCLERCSVCAHSSTTVLLSCQR